MLGAVVDTEITHTTRHVPATTAVAGGSGCGDLGSADCCYDFIVNAGLVCGVDVLEAPCIVVEFTPAPLAEGETAAPLPAPTSTAPATAAPATAAPAPVAPAAETEAPSTPAPGVTESPVSRDGVVGVPTPSPGGSAMPQETVAPAPSVGGGGVGTPAPSAPGVLVGGVVSFYGHTLRSPPESADQCKQAGRKLCFVTIAVGVCTRASHPNPCPWGSSRPVLVSRRRSSMHTTRKITEQFLFPRGCNVVLHHSRV